MSNEIQNTSPRSWIIRIMFSIMAIVLIFRLFSLQVMDDKYLALANDQAIFKRVIYPARGNIVDRNGKSLMQNNVSFDLTVIPSQIRAELDTQLLCQILNIDIIAFNTSLEKLIGRNGRQRSSVFKQQLDKKESAHLLENIYLFPGFELAERTTRNYPEPIGAHIFGYIAEISPNMLLNDRYGSYRQGDYVGVTGLENVYEEVLRGQRGVEYLVRDVLNRPRDSYKDGELDTPAIGGKTLELHLDGDLQAYAEKLMAGKMGSAVAIDPQTGGILAMVSAPSFDPNLLSGSDRSRNIGKLFSDGTTPMVNRAIQSTYPPGSTFKPFTALVALDIGVITPSFGMGCSGGYYGCGRLIRCTHSNPGHASSLRKALESSCNSYFCHIFRLSVDAKKFGGVKAGMETWMHYMNNFGFGHNLGIDITGEKGGNVPDTNYFNRIYDNRWNSCNMTVMGMGQGELLLTPMQLANGLCIIANKGYYYTPHFVRSVDGNEKDSILAPYLKKHKVTNIPEAFYQEVIDGMEDVVKSGTGRLAQLPGIAVCGKTGTAENHALINGKITKLDNHSVFICFAPKDNPKIAIAVVVQNSGYGATWAGPVASLMMEKYLTDTVKRIPLQERMFSANIIKPYIYYLDSVQREKDRAREFLRTADKRYRDSVKNRMDTLLVRDILDNYFQTSSKSFMRNPKEN